MGYVARLQDIVVDGNSGRNVVADKEGHANGARGVVLVTAHLDSINTQGGPAAPAPGADDNGSGSAGLIEMMRAFEDHRGEHNLRAVLFGGEEEGLLGSKQYLANLSAAERERIRAVVNMDMIGTLNVPTHSVLIEGAPSSQKVIDRLSQAAMTYTRLAVETSLHTFASDHVPFRRRNSGGTYDRRGRRHQRQRPLRRGHHRPHRLRFCAGDPAHERRVRGPHGRPGTAVGYLLEPTGLGSGRLPGSKRAAGSPVSCRLGA